MNRVNRAIVFIVTMLVIFGQKEVVSDDNLKSKKVVLSGQVLVQDKHRRELILKYKPDMDPQIVFENRSDKFLLDKSTTNIDVGSSWKVPGVWRGAGQISIEAKVNDIGDLVYLPESYTVSLDRLKIEILLRTRENASSAKFAECDNMRNSPQVNETALIGCFRGALNLDLQFKIENSLGDVLDGAGKYDECKKIFENLSARAKEEGNSVRADQGNFRAALCLENKALEIRQEKAWEEVSLFVRLKFREGLQNSDIRSKMFRIWFDAIIKRSGTADYASVAFSIFKFPNLFDEWKELYGSYFKNARSALSANQIYSQLNQIADQYYRPNSPGPLLRQ